MNQLFTIMRRWLLHDKKRTLLTLASITLSVFLITFVGVYICTGLNAIHARIMYEEPYHVTLFPESVEQIKILDKNVAWESHAAEVWFDGFGVGTMTENMIGSDEKLFPDFTINGTSEYRLTAVMRSGDEQLFGSSGDSGSTVPSKPHEVIVNASTANSLGIKKGDTVTIRCSGRSGKLFYGELDENGEPVKDSDGNVIFREDTDGSKYAELRELLAELAENDEYYMISRIFERLYSADRRQEKIDIYGTVDDLPPMYAELYGEQRTFAEYTAAVTGIPTDTGANLYFSADDTDILPFFGINDPNKCKNEINFYARVKKDIDAEEASVNAAKGIGIFSDNSKGYELNIELLQLEGRQYEYLDNIVGVFVLITIVMGLFVFLARLIINNAFEISAAYRTEQYGALKTIGASDRQIFTMIMMECAVYMVIALPAGMGLAVLFGRTMLSQIRAIKVFDPIYGDGISDKFFTLELYPAVMWLTFACSLFSVFFSAYADAMRVKRLQPIRSAGYSSSKNRIKGHNIWLTRKLFGYPFGFAVKCISRQKVRFLVTLLASVISGIFIMTLGCIAKNYSDSRKKSDVFAPLRYDIEIEDYINLSDDEDTDIGSLAEEIKKNFESLLGAGCYEDVISDAMTILPNKNGHSMDALLSDGFRKLNSAEAGRDYGDYEYYDYRYDFGKPDDTLSLIVSLIPRENYDKYIKTDISYDELAASGKVLLCGSVCTMYGEGENTYKTDAKTIKRYKDRNGMIYDVLDMNAFGTADIGTLSFTGDYPMEQGEAQTFTETVDTAGQYTTERVEYMSQPHYLMAVLPIDSVNIDFQTAYKNGAEPRWFRHFTSSFRLTAKEGMKSQARDHANSLFVNKEHIIVTDHVAEDTFEQNGIKALKIVGFSFSGALAAVVLLNIFSTMSANMINRRRDLSMMRSCGMSMNQVTLSLVIESSFYAVITAVVSSFAGCVLSGGIINITASGKDPTLGELILSVGFPVWGMLGLFAVVMLVMAAAYIPALVIMNRSSIAQEIRTKI